MTMVLQVGEVLLCSLKWEGTVVVVVDSGRCAEGEAGTLFLRKMREAWRGEVIWPGVW